MNEPLVIYHGHCPDGFTAAWVAARALGGAELFLGKYGDDPPYELAAHRSVFVVDFSYPRAQLERLHALAGRLVVLDHHKTAQADCEGLDYCTFDMERSGARLTWDHFHGINRAPPWIVRYVEDRDLWRFALPDSEAISLRVRLTPHELEAYDALAERSEANVAEEGRGGLLYLQHYVRDACRNAVDLVQLYEDETVRCVNVSYTGVSDVLNALLTPALDHPARKLFPDAHRPSVRCALAWHLTKDWELQCSLRSTQDYDCSAFAKAHGGGGHAQASGFRLQLTDPLALRLTGYITGPETKG